MNIFYFYFLIYKIKEFIKLKNLYKYNYLYAIKTSENFRNIDISNIIKRYDNQYIRQSFIVIVGNNHVEHMISIMKKYNIIHIY
mgnify:CR=1 FL=1